MYSLLQKLIKYITYWLTAANGKGHGIHSPFVFQFVTDILNDNRFFYAFETLEAIKSQQQEFRKYNQLLFKIVNYYQPKTGLCIDESTNNTINYLAAGNSNSQIFYKENNLSQEKNNVENYQQLYLENVFLVDDLSLMKTHQYDLVYINTNNNNNNELENYFQILVPYLTAQSIVIINHIHLGKQFEVTWNNIQHHPSVTLSIDLFQLGLVFFRPENKVPQHFTIRF